MQLGRKAAAAASSSPSKLALLSHAEEEYNHDIIGLKKRSNPNSQLEYKILFPQILPILTISQNWLLLLLLLLPFQ